MNSPFVATLIAPVGVVLGAAQTDLVIRQITAAGGRIEKTVSVGQGRAVDVFFTGAPVDIVAPDFDVLIQPVATRRKKLLLADMESTIIEQEMLDVLAHMIGIGPQVAAITHRAMNGEMNFAEALAERVWLLKGQPESLLYQASARMGLMPGARALVAAMKEAGAVCWLVSGGFDVFARIVAQEAGFDEYFANHLLVEDGVLTGEVALPLLDKESKKILLEEACAEFGCSLAETLTIGDGANDVPMLRACADGGGLGVAYHAKPHVREVIHNRIDYGDLSALIYAQALG